MQMVSNIISCCCCCCDSIVVPVTVAAATAISIYICHNNRNNRNLCGCVHVGAWSTHLTWHSVRAFSRRVCCERAKMLIGADVAGVAGVATSAAHATVALHWESPSWKNFAAVVARTHWFARYCRFYFYFHFHFHYDFHLRLHSQFHFHTPLCCHFHWKPPWIFHNGVARPAAAADTLRRSHDCVFYWASTAPSATSTWRCCATFSYSSCSVYSIYFRTPFMVEYQINRIYFRTLFYIIRNDEEASLRAPHKLLATTFCVQLIIDDAHRARGDSVPCCWHHVADIKYKCTRAACAPFVCG